MNSLWRGKGFIMSWRSDAVKIFCKKCDSKGLFKMYGEIQKVAENWEIPIEILSSEQAGHIKNSIYQKYTDGGMEGVLWGHLIDYSVLRDSYAWAIIDEFVDWDYKDKEESLLFFNDEDDKNVFIIKNGRDLYKILSETCENREFYLTNFNTNYLICFNRYDCLYGTGAAREWVGKQFKGV